MKRDNEVSLDPHNIHDKILRSSQLSGQLNLSNRGLQYVPSTIWKLNTQLPPTSSSFDFNASGDDSRWWETRAIERLILSSNKISELNGTELVQLNSLTFFDIRDNMLTSLPREIEMLTLLKQIVLSSNRLTCLPSTFSNLKNLVWLDISHNEIIDLPADFESLTALERLDSADGKLSRLPDRLPSKLAFLNVCKNKLQCIPVGLLQNSKNLRDFNASENSIENVGIVSSSVQRPSSCLSVLNLHKNKISEFPDLSYFEQLKEITLGDNQISGISITLLENCLHLATLDLARNRLTSLPNGLPKSLPKLTRLDLSNNDLLSIPTELGFWDSLHVLTVIGNPLRSISQNVISTGTESIKSLLRSRHDPNESLNETSLVNSLAYIGSSSDYSYLPCVSTSGILDWSIQVKRGNAGKTHETPASSGQELPPLDNASIWSTVSLHGCESSAIFVRDVRLISRLLESFPFGLLAFEDSLISLDLSKNNLQELPPEIDRFANLQLLNLSSNKLHSLNSHISNLAFLQTLILDFNSSLGPELSMGIFGVEPLSKCLQNLSVRGCRLKCLPSASFLQANRMPSLQSLDVSDNDIAFLEPELGLCAQIKSLQVNGNLFRIPRREIVDKGTSAVMEYLRSRIPAS